MTVTVDPKAKPGRSSQVPLRPLPWLLAGLLGVAGALLVACGGSGANLIPAANAGPLSNDFEEVAQLALNANGSCSATEAAVLKTEQDYRALPTSVNAGLRAKLDEGIANLARRARVQCAQASSATTGASTTTAATTTTATTPTTTTPTTPTTTTPTTPTTTATTPSTTTSTPTGPAGGTPGPGEGEPKQGGEGNGGVGLGEGGKK